MTTRDHEEDTHLSLSTVIVMTTLAVVVCVVGLLLASPVTIRGGATSASSTTHEGAEVGLPGGISRVTVNIEGFTFNPSRIEIPVGNSVEITVLNNGDQNHDLVFNDPNDQSLISTGTIAPGKTGHLTLPALTQSTQGWCSLPGHRAAGMTLDIITSNGNSDTSTPADTTADSGHAHAHGGNSAAAAHIPSMDTLSEYAARVEPYPAKTAPVNTPPGSEHKLTLRAQETTQTLADGTTRTLWTFNGISPGPTLRGKVGDTFRITLINDGTLGHSIDFHAGDVAPDAPMRTIAPGESLEYVFTAHRAGIWMYHCGTRPMSLHIAAGMFGAVIIDPPDLEPVDDEYVLVAGEVYPDTTEGIVSPAHIAALSPDLTAFNGRPHQYVAHPLSAQVGKKVRLWVLNAGPNADMAFHVVGAQFDTVWNEGAYTLLHGGNPGMGADTGRGGSQVLPLLAAQGGFVEFTPVEEGTYTFVNHIMSLAEKGARGQIVVTKQG